jgi:protein involved in polysaccharide export with SLBB domain
MLGMYFGFPLPAQEEEVVTTQQTSNTGADLSASSVDASRNIMLARSNTDYMVTPGDVYTLAYSAGSNPVSYTITVDTSYRIRVSNLGIVNGAGKTFPQLRREVENIVANNYPLSGVQLVLTQPAIFSVYVKGEVYTSGEVAAWGLSRLSSLAGGNLTGYASIRDISIRSAGGQARVYDLFKAQRLGDLSQDPYLRPGDIVTFNRIDRVVTINGAVERPGRYQILKGENLKNLIEVYGNGFTPLVDKTRITLTRYVGSTELSGDITYLTEQDLTGDYNLQHLDVISAPAITASRPAVYITRVERRITINGAVRRPGTYDLLPNENILELIEAYGDGFTPLADPTRIELVRLVDSTDIAGDRIFLTESDLVNNYVLEHFDVVTVPSIIQLRPVMFVEGAVASVQQALDDLGQSTTTAAQDLTSSNRLVIQFVKGETYASLVRRNINWFTAVSDTQNAYILRNNERIPINLNPMLYDVSFRNDVLVLENDVLIIPFRQYFVTVAGAVASPGRYPYIPDRDWEYYIALAGGFIMERNIRQTVTITDLNGKRMKKTDAITPETVITASTNHGLYYFNQFAPVVTTILSIFTTIFTVILATR